MVTLTNKRGLPKSIVSAIELYSSKYHRGDADISMTQLIDAPKIKILKEEYADKLEEDVSEVIWRVFGNAVHKLFEDSDKDKNTILEKRFFGKCNGWTVSGAIDKLKVITELVEGKWEADQQLLPIKKATIYDYKCVSTWQIFKNTYHPKDYKDEWENQLNGYAWLLRQNGYVVEGARIIALARDWQKSKAWFESEKAGYDPDIDYPDVQIKVIAIRLWSNEKQDEYMRSRVETHQQADQLFHTQKIQVDCTDKELWKDPAKFAVMKKGKKRALKLFDDREDAQDHAKNFKDTSIEIRPSVARRWASYCNVINFCEQGRRERNGLQSTHQANA